MKKKKFLIAIGIICIAASALAGYAIWRRVGGKRLPNILIVSFCSLRKQQISAYFSGATPLPNIDKFFSESLVFENAVNGLPWTNITNHIRPKIFQAMGYTNAKRRTFRVPPNSINKFRPNGDVDAQGNLVNFESRTYELNYKEGMKLIEDKLKSKDLERPFFLVAHIKYLHLPFIDSVNQPDLWKTRLNPRSAELLKKYLASPEQYPEKAPLFLALFADPRLVAKNKSVRRFINDFKHVHMGQVYQVLADDGILAAWKSSPAFKDDLSILSEAYELKLKVMDDELKGLLELYGNRDLQKNTMIVFTGDHGETFMEHDGFMHANDITDEQSEFPLAIKPPGRFSLDSGVRIQEQVDMTKATRLMRMTIQADFKIKDVKKALGLHKTIFLRNCQGSIQGIRSQSKFKLSVDADNWKLVDMVADPLEKTDVKMQKTDVFLKLKEEFLQLSVQKRFLSACDELGAPLPQTDAAGGRDPTKNHLEP